MRVSGAVEDEPRFLPLGAGPPRDLAHLTLRYQGSGRGCLRASSDAVKDTGEVHVQSTFGRFDLHDRKYAPR